MKEQYFDFIYVHPVVFLNTRMAVNITVKGQAQFYKDGTVRTVNVAELQAMDAQIPISYMQMVSWDLWEAIDAAAFAHAQSKFNSPVNS